MKIFTKLWWYKLLGIKYCHKCLSTHQDWGYWTRAWDMKYGGAHGDMGHRCYDCGYIDWKNPIDIYRTWYGTNWKVFEDSPRYIDGTLQTKPMLVNAVLITEEHDRFVAPRYNRFVAPRYMDRELYDHIARMVLW